MLNQAINPGQLCNLDSPCGVWGRGWTTCLLHDSPLFGSHSKMRVGKFGVIFHIFIISCLCSRFHAWNQWFFYSIITFSYTKYFVHSYNVNVVFTLSYKNFSSKYDEIIYTPVLMSVYYTSTLITAAKRYTIHVSGGGKRCLHMMTSFNGNIFRVTGPLCGEFTGHRWIPLTKASDAELWSLSLICTRTNSWANNRDAGDFGRRDSHYDVTVMNIQDIYVIPFLLAVFSK